MERIVLPKQDLTKPKKADPNKKKVKKKKTERAIAKEDAWDAFSRYIRLRDCIRFRDSIDEGRCVTCRRDYPFKKLQAGHFLSGRGNAVLFDEDVVYSQCFGCNGNPPFGKGGNYVEYFLFMEKEHGRKKLDEILTRKNKTVVYKIYDFINIREKYKQKHDELLENYKKTH